MEEVKAGILFQDGCVLQREKEIPVWGEGPEGAQVVVSLAGNQAVCRVKESCPEEGMAGLREIPRCRA